MRRSWWVLGACILLAVPTAVDPVSRVAGPTYLLGLAVIVLALWRAVHEAPRPARTSWILLALAASSWLAGDVLQRAVTLLGGVDDEVGVQDLFWLSSYVFLTAGVLAVIRARGLPSGLSREIGLDVVVVGAAAGVWAWHLLVAPIFGQGGQAAYTVVAALYPLGDTAVFALAMTLLMSPGGGGVAGRLLVWCLGLTLPLDALLTVLPHVLPDFEVARLDGALLIVNGLLAAAALHPDRDALTRRAHLPRGHGLHRWRVVLLGFSLCTASTASLLPGRGPADLVVSVVATVVITMTVVLRFYGVVRDREAAEAGLLHAATHDLLTGTANRHLLMERLRAAASSSDSTGVVLIFLDLDGFKAVNDTLGHAAGDEVLRAVAARLIGLFRVTDTVARVGGDEFVVLAHGVSAHEAAGLGERICAAVRMPVPLLTDQARVGASVGVLTTLACGALDPDDLLRQADAAMYAAKRDGTGVHTLAAFA